MEEYLGIGSHGLTNYLDVYGVHSQYQQDSIFNEGPKKKARTNRYRFRLDPNFLQVRSSICIVGFNGEAVQKVKQYMAGLLDDALPLESFHVKDPSDVRDGALLVPKLVLVGQHIAGRKLIDSDGEEGQLDAIYDEACELGADILVVYLGLPRIVYKPIRHMVYHPKMTDSVFPYQPVLKELAHSNCLVTVVENTELTNMQKNVIREWMTKPVGTSHAVYQAAEYLSSVEFPMTDTEFWQEGEHSAAKQRGFHTDGEVLERSGEASFLPATEEHPILDSKKNKKKKKKLKKRRETGEWGKKTVDLKVVNEAYDDRDDDGNIELELYSKPASYGGGYGSYGSLDSWNASMDV